MPGNIAIRVQAVVVVLLFLASLATVLVGAFQALYLPHGERQVQDRLEEASRLMADAADAVLGPRANVERGDFDGVNVKLREVSERVLASFPGVEGGFYVSDGIGRFAGYAFPTDEVGDRRHGPVGGGPVPGKASPKDGASKRPNAQPAFGDDPPPREKDFILVQVQQSMNLEPEMQFDVRTVGPSRVAVATQPVGSDRPARLATWVMFRVTKPEDLATKAFRYQVSTGLALGGMALAGLLTVNLGGRLRQQRLDQDRLRREQEQLREELRRSEHLAALGKLLAGMAHEVRNPLAGIRSTVQLWERLPDTARTPGSMNAVIRAVDRLNEIVTRLLYFSRADSAQRQPVDINQLLGETFELLKAQAESQAVDLEQDLDEGLPAVLGAASALRQVFLNLASNALQAMPGGGRLRCATRLHAETRMAEVRFEDTGPGIAAAEQERLFEPFFTTRPEGTGLGLALCREIVVQHGGRIEYVSGDRSGAIFRLLLPTVLEETATMETIRRQATILVADDDAAIRGNLRLLLESEGYKVVEAADGLQAGKWLADPALALALLDLKMPERSGMDLLREHQEQLEETPVIVVTALGGSAAAIEAMKLGAFDYITKPFDLDEVLFAIRRALTQKALISQVQALAVAADTSSPSGTAEELVGRTPAMLQVFKAIGRVAAALEPVLILGESGTGKELVASAVHNNSERADHAFIKVNCAALSPTLLESELFGHERGAFTGAVSRRIGRFEQASGGTLFLDEIGDLDPDLQAKLLRILQTGQFERVGGNELVTADVRVVSATNRDLPTLIQQRRFREDLFYRLNVVTIELPPLRSRRDDIPLLAEHIVGQLARKYRWPQLALAPESLQHLTEQPWPGNVRELQNVLARAAILARGHLILPDDLWPSAAATAAKTPDQPPEHTMLLKDILAETEHRVIQHALEQTKWNRTRAARLLGISRRQLFDKIQQYGLRE